MKSEGYIWLEYIDRKGFEFEEILRLLSLLNGEEGEEEVGIFSKIMRLYKSNKEKEKKISIRLAWNSKLKKSSREKWKVNEKVLKNLPCLILLIIIIIPSPSLFFHRHSGNLANNLQIEKARKRAPIIGRQSMKLARAER